MKMKHFFLLFLAIFLPGSRSSPDEDRLLKYLFDPEYQSNNLMTTPVSSTNETLSVVLSIEFQKLIALEEVEEVLKLQYWMLYKWSDYRLNFNASDFGGLERVSVPASKMWKPDLLLSNNAKVAEDNEVTPQSNYVWIREHGHCEWAPRYDLSVSHCTVDVTWFPFDEQTCYLTFESWMLDANALKIVPDNNSVGLQDFKEPEGWYLLGIDVTTGVTRYNFSNVTFTFRLLRKPLYYVVNHIAPCCLLSFVAVATFLLPPGCTERLGLAITVLLAMSVYQIIITDRLPSSYDSPPVIVKYVLFVKCMSIFAVAGTIVVMCVYLRAESKHVTAMPAWIKNLFCKKLATCLCMKPPPSPSLEPPLLYAKSGSVVIGDHCSNGPQHVDVSTPHSSKTQNDSAKKVLTEIRDLLKTICDLMTTRVHNEEEQSYEADKENEMKNDWMLAAAVLDRICAIAALIVFVGGNLIFFYFVRNSRL